MKTSAVLSIVTLAVTAFADPTPDNNPTPVKRDLATVTSVVAQVSAAMTQLDTSVKAFTGDMNKLKSDADNLITVLKSGATTIGASTPLSAADATGLQTIVTNLQTAGQTLVNDLTGKKTQIQQAGQCTTVQTSINDVATNSKALVDAVVAKVPTEFQSVASGLAAGLTNTLNQGAAAFAPGSCNNTEGATSITSGTTGATSTATVTVTITAPCSGLANPTLTSPTRTTTAITTSVATLTSVTLITSGTSIRTSTFTTTRSTTSTSIGSGITSRPPVVTAAAAANGVGPMGMAAGIIALLVL